MCTHWDRGFEAREGDGVFRLRSLLLFLSASTGWLQGKGQAETGIEELNLSREPGCGSGSAAGLDGGGAQGPPRWERRRRSCLLEFPRSAALLAGTWRHPPEPGVQPGETPETQPQPPYLDPCFHICG